MAKNKFKPSTIVIFDGEYEMIRNGKVVGSDFFRRGYLFYSPFLVDYFKLKSPQRKLIII